MGEQPKPLEVVVSTTTKVKQTLGAQHFGPGGETKGVRVVDDRGQSLAADVRADGSVWVRIEGTGVSGRVDEALPCQILVNRFNAGSRQWADPVARLKEKAENGVDVMAEHLHGGTPLQFQVTRVDPGPELWYALSNTGAAEKIYPSVDAVADAVRDAIWEKRNMPQKGIILVLNGVQLPIGLPQVLESFERRHGTWLRSLKFEEVWVVEPFHDEPWTCRLFKMGA